MQDNNNTIKNKTLQTTQNFLKKALEVIKEDLTAIKFRKGSSENGEKIEGLEFSIIKDDKGNYYVIFGRKNGIILGEGSFNRVFLINQLILIFDVNGELIDLHLGKEMVVKKRKVITNVDKAFADFESDYLKAILYQKVPPKKQLRINWKGENKFYLFDELEPGVPLLEAFYSGVFKTMPLTKRIDFILSILPQLITLHKRAGHRDLKPANIMYDSSTNTGEIIDFGFTTKLGETSSEMTVYYAAPEMVFNKTVTTANDIYALGLIFLQLFHFHSKSPDYKDKDEYEDQCPIFKNKNLKFDQFKRIAAFIREAPNIEVSPIIFECIIDPFDGYNFYENLLNFLANMTNHKPMLRPTALEIQEFFVNFKEKYQRALRRQALVNEKNEIHSSAKTAIDKLKQRYKQLISMPSYLQEIFTDLKDLHQNVEKLIKTFENQQQDFLKKIEHLSETDHFFQPVQEIGNRLILSMQTLKDKIQSHIEYKIKQDFAQLENQVKEFCNFPCPENLDASKQALKHIDFLRKYVKEDRSQYPFYSDEVNLNQLLHLLDKKEINLFHKIEEKQKEAMGQDQCKPTSMIKARREIGYMFFEQKNKEDRTSQASPKCIR